MHTVLITGAGSGIGAACARAVASKGAGRIALHCNASSLKAAELAEELRASGCEVGVFNADFSVAGAAEELCRAVSERFGELDSLVCNAGAILTKPLSMTSFAEWRRIHDINLDAAFLLTKFFSKAMMRRRSGSIVYVSSEAALLGDVFRAAYCSSKAGLLGLCRAASRELAPMGIRVNAVAPGIIRSGMTSDMDEGRRRKQLEAIALRRFGEPEEVARAVAFLLSGNASYITGQVLGVDGAMA